MQCEVCGSEIRGRSYYKIIEGGRMTVCGRCASFGSSDWDPRQRTTQRRQPRRKAQPRNEVEAAEVLELVEDYGTKIRKARQARRMTVEDLAKKINEKESVIKKLEKEELSPDRNLVRKIKNSLGLDILVMGETAPISVAGRIVTGRTLGDIMKMSKANRKEENES